MHRTFRDGPIVRPYRHPVLVFLGPNRTQLRSLLIVRGGRSLGRILGLVLLIGQLLGLVLVRLAQHLGLVRIQLPILRTVIGVGVILGLATAHRVGDIRSTYVCALIILYTSAKHRTVIICTDVCACPALDYCDWAVIGLTARYKKRSTNTQE